MNKDAEIKYLKDQLDSRNKLITMLFKEKEVLIKTLQSTHSTMVLEAEKLENTILDLVWECKK